MTRTEIVKAVTKWFDVDKYNVLSELTVEQIYIEVERRVLAYNLLTQYDSLKPHLKLLLMIMSRRYSPGKSSLMRTLKLTSQKKSFHQAT